MVNDWIIFTDVNNGPRYFLISSITSFCGASGWEPRAAGMVCQGVAYAYVRETPEEIAKALDVNDATTDGRRPPGEISPVSSSPPDPSEPSEPVAR